MYASLIAVGSLETKHGKMSFTIYVNLTGFLLQL